MSANINLLLHRDEELLKQKNRIKGFNLAAVLSLVGVGLISISIFLLTQSVAIEASSATKDQENILRKIFQFQNRQIKLFIVNNRVENIDKIMKTKKDLSKTTGSLLAKVPDGLSVNNFEITDKEVILTGKSESLAVIGELINNLTDMVRKNEIIKSLTLSSLALEQSSGVYTVSVKSEL